MLFDKQFGFQPNNSIEHAILQLVNDICSSFERREYTLGIFIDLSEAFGTVDHEILISKLEYYGIKGKNFKMAQKLPKQMKAMYILLRCWQNKYVQYYLWHSTRFYSRSITISYLC